jgi:hypothetical protein
VTHVTNKDYNLSSAVVVFVEINVNGGSAISFFSFSNESKELSENIEKKKGKKN